MHTVLIRGRLGLSRILVGETLANLPLYVPSDRRLIIITDEVVNGIYADRFPAAEVIIIGCGEAHKNLETVAAVYEQLIALEADRSAFIVGIGGGIVGDVSGFAAATYMRGLPFGFVATSLLAQVDASVGGKNGVNVKGYKNMAGLFVQPEFVIADMATLETLPPSELVCGLAEIVKHACLADEHYLSFIESHTGLIAALDAEVMTRLVHESVMIKAAVVNRDEKEAGERRKLNFGHTFGHALERTLGLSHGAAVSMGMVLAARFSQFRGYLQADEVRRLISLLRTLNLPVDLDFNPTAVFAALKKDKKRQGDRVHFVFLEALGRALVEPVALAEVERWLQEYIR